MLNVDEGNIKPAMQCIPKNLYLLLYPKNYDENCWIVTYRDKLLVIPCIEIARALLAPSRFLTNALIDPVGLQYLIDEVEEHGGKKVIKLYEKDEKATKNTKTSTDKKEGVLDDSLSPSLNEKVTSHVKVKSTKLKFATKPNVEILDSDKVATKRVGTDVDNVGKSVSNIVTTVRASRGGKVKPVEFETKDSGLEDFMNAVRHLIMNNDIKVLDIQIADLLGDLGISFITEHVRRKFMYVLLKVDDEREVLLIEMGRPDYKSISTLVVVPKYNEVFGAVHKRLVWRVIQSLIENRGSWNREQLNQDRTYKFYFMKHTKVVSTARSSRIYKKLHNFK